MPPKRPRPPFKPPRPSQPAASQPSSSTPNTPLTPAQHQILLRHRLSHATINALVALPPASPPDLILSAACHASELLSTPLRPAEHALFAHLNANPCTLWPLAAAHVSQTWEKAFLLCQAQASGEEWAFAPRISQAARSVLLSERGRVVRAVVSALRCAADLAGDKRDAAGMRVALELARSIAAGAWEGTDGRELLQVPGIGGRKMQALAAAGVKTVKKLAGMEFFHVERLVKRNPPFGHEVAAKLEGFPRTGMRTRVERWADEEDVKAARELEGTSSWPGVGRELAVVRVQVWVDNPAAPRWRDKTPWVCVAAERGPRVSDADRIARSRWGRRDPGTGPGGAVGQRELLFFWRGNSKNLLGQGRTLVFVAPLTPGEAIYVWASCEEVVGTLVETVVEAPGTMPGGTGGRT